MSENSCVLSITPPENDHKPETIRVKSLNSTECEAVRAPGTRSFQIKIEHLIQELLCRELERDALCETIDCHLLKNSLDDEDSDEDKVDLPTAMDLALHHKKQVKNIRLQLKHLGFTNPFFALVYDSSVLRFECNTLARNCLFAILPSAVARVCVPPFTGSSIRVLRLPSCLVVLVKDEEPRNSKARSLFLLDFCSQDWSSVCIFENTAEQMRVVKIPIVAAVAAHAATARLTSALAKQGWTRVVIYGCCPQFESKVVTSQMAKAVDCDPAASMSDFVFVVGSTESMAFQGLTLLCWNTRLSGQLLDESVPTAVDLTENVRVLHSNLFQDLRSALYPSLVDMCQIALLVSTSSPRGLLCAIEVQQGIFCHVFDARGEVDWTQGNTFRLELMECDWFSSVVDMQLVPGICASFQIARVEETKTREARPLSKTEQHFLDGPLESWNKSHTDEALQHIHSVLRELCWCARYTSQICCNPFRPILVGLPSRSSNFKNLIFTDSPKIPFVRLDLDKVEILTKRIGGVHFNSETGISVQHAFDVLIKP
jgi:hypothetical protein